MDEKFIRNIFYFKNFYLDFFDGLKPEVKKEVQLDFEINCDT